MDYVPQFEKQQSGAVCLLLGLPFKRHALLIQENGCSLQRLRWTLRIQRRKDWQMNVQSVAGWYSGSGGSAGDENCSR